MSRYYYKRIVLSFSSRDEVIRFLELMTRRVRASQIVARTKPNNQVELVLQGDPEEISVMIYDLRRLANAIRAMSRRVHELTSYDISVLLDLAKLEASIPIDAVLEALRLSGFRVEERSGRIVTNADLNEVLSVMERMSALYKKMMDLPLTPQVKRIVAICAVASGRDLEETIEMLLNANVIQRHAQTGLLTLAVSYGDAVKALGRMCVEDRLTS